MKRGLLFLLVVFALLSLTGCLTTNHDKQATPEKTLERTTMSVSRTEYPFNHFPKYRIAPGDVLDVLFQIRTWQEKPEFLLAVDHTVAVTFPEAPELNVQQFIRPDGKITLPYIGEKHVVGMTVAELSKELREQYKTILQSPEFYITVPDFRSSIKELKADLHTAPRGLSRLVTVSPDGYVTFPMVGEHYVYNKTITETNEILNEKYEQIMQGLHVDLFLEKSAGSLISVSGQVANPGVFNITKPITVVEAIALAGGHLSRADLSSVIVVRRHGTKLVATRINVGATLDLEDDSKFFFLQSDDILYLPKTKITRAAEVAQEIADLLLFRGWNVGFSWELHDQSVRDRGLF